jgi:hypothetical protein
MTKGQRAMVAAMAYPEPEVGGSGKASAAKGFDVASKKIVSATNCQA